tara:strand:+ start:2338 stop:2826 length:489 start_codon:yes stop_codon:yes gene_type:complete
MKIKVLALALFISFCSQNTVGEGIFIETSDLNSLKTLDTGENIDISEADLLVINYWASWCLECIEEHPYLIELSKTKGFENAVYMLSFQDSRENALKFISEYGSGNINYLVDENSKVAIYSGVFGVPETHIIKNGEVIKKYIGPISLNDLQEIINNYSHLTN